MEEGIFDEKDGGVGNNVGDLDSKIVNKNQHDIKDVEEKRREEFIRIQMEKINRKLNARINTDTFQPCSNDEEEDTRR
ncbi:hypothetical protein DPMN_054143 [Dreissena polymorpha]|uniref:Uncharacterized protein n=1 Tax=Dreissena polymorpha TaxID=45954 RepID=A0A9D4CMN7_DREPO|nr:hypothetical protein DPMN_054143 [Dreissena polymorpha]